MADRQEHSADSPSQQRLRFELLFGSAWLALGLFVLPAVIYTVGAALLGAYGEGATSGGLGTFYGDFFGDLAGGEVRTWLLALGPLLLISLLRLVFVGTKDKAPSVPEETPDPPPARQSDSRRVEPRVGAE